MSSKDIRTIGILDAVVAGIGIAEIMSLPTYFLWRNKKKNEDADISTAQLTYSTFQPTGGTDGHDSIPKTQIQKRDSVHSRYTGAQVFAKRRDDISNGVQISPGF